MSHPFGFIGQLFETLFGRSNQTSSIDPHDQVVAERARRDEQFDVFM